LGNQSVEVSISGLLNVQRSLADVVDGLIVQQEGNISVLQEGVGGQHRVVWLNNRGGHLRRGIDAEIQLRLLSVVDGQSLQEEGSKSRSSSSSNRVEDEESLESSALVSELSDSVQGQVNELLSNSVVSSGVVVSSILLSSQKLVWVEQFSVFSTSDFVDDRWLEIDEDCSWNVFARTGLREEGVEGIILLSKRGIPRHGSIGLNSVLEAVQLPAGISQLDSSLSDVD